MLCIGQARRGAINSKSRITLVISRIKGSVFQEAFRWFD